MPIGPRSMPTHSLPSAKDLPQHLHRRTQWQNRQIHHRKEQSRLHPESLLPRAYCRSSLFRELLPRFSQQTALHQLQEEIN